MDWGSLSFLAEPWFVIPWYAVGVLGAAAVIRDVSRVNTPLKQAMKWGWPIIVLFFSVVGIALYLGTARAPGIADRLGDDAKRQAHERYERNMFRRVNGAVIHCVAGDGLGIMTGMVIARATGMSFWQEFWFEYLVGFLFGWLIFQLKSMTMMTDSTGRALLLAFRAEFFSMLTVMSGMGAVMAYVTPLAVTAQPKPLTYAFWGFGMLGLLVGYVFTFPMNWMMVKLGWKHGMGGAEAGHQVEGEEPKAALVAAVCALGAVALAFPAWLAEVRDSAPVAPGAAGLRSGAGPSPMMALAGGLETDLEVAARGLAGGRRSEASHALDAARRAAEVGNAAAPRSVFGDVAERVRRVRRALHMGDETSARDELSAGASELRRASFPRASAAPDPERFAGATVVDAEGVKIGEVSGVSSGELHLTLGRRIDVFGFLDLGTRTQVTVPANELVFGPSGAVGPRLVGYPVVQETASQGRRAPGRARR